MLMPDTYKRHQIRAKELGHAGIAILCSNALPDSVTLSCYLHPICKLQPLRIVRNLTMSSTTTTTQTSSKPNGVHPIEVQGGDAIYKFPTGPMVLGEAPIFRKSDNTLHLVDCIKEPCELHILKLDPVTGDVVDSKVHILEESVTVQFFRRNKPGCE